MKTRAIVSVILVFILLLTLPVYAGAALINETTVLAYDQKVFDIISAGTSPQSFLVGAKKPEDEIKAKALEITKDCSSDYNRAAAIHDWVQPNHSVFQEPVRRKELNSPLSA